MLEVLVTFERERGSSIFTKRAPFNFRVGLPTRMNLMKFSVSLGLYDEFTHTPVYDTLLIKHPFRKSHESCSKATSLRSQALRYIHHFLNHSLTERGDSTGVVSWRDFDNLLSIIDGFNPHLGYEVA